MRRTAPAAFARGQLLALILLVGGSALQVARGEEAPLEGQDNAAQTVQAEAANPVPAAEAAESGAGQEPARQAGEQSLLDAISRIESSDGAYAAGLSEQMLSLGLTLQQQKRHAEAVDVFKRGAHLARVNNGLYCPEQIPLVQGEIKSFIALGQYAEVDDLQKYLYRVQQRSLASGEERAVALVQQANWQFNAYRMGLGEQVTGADRLMTMWELYRSALNELIDSDGESSPKLLPPLYGMLRTQYLVTSYRGEQEQTGNSFDANHMGPELGRFYGFRSANYDTGKSVLQVIYDLQRKNKGADSDEAIDALVAMGDWALWNERRDEWRDIYRQALAELALADDAKDKEQRLFAEPVPLPDMEGLRALPPAVSAEEGNILVEFGVDNRGEVVDLVRIDTNEDSDAAANGLMRVLRNMKFRPRFEAGEPAGTDKLVRAYDIKP